MLRLIIAANWQSIKWSAWYFAITPIIILYHIFSKNAYWANASVNFMYAALTPGDGPNMDNLDIVNAYN